MIKAALDLQQEGLVYYMNGGVVERPRAPLASSYHEAPYGIYRTADGYIALSLSPIEIIAAALGDPPALEAFRDREDALPRRDEIYEALAPLLETRETAELVDTLRSHSVWCGPVHDYAAVLADPAVRYADPWLDIDHPQAGRVRLVGHPVEYSSGRPGVRRVPPRLGEHTNEILRSLGLETGQIEALRAAGAV
jgi:crotonobetainyl-CoA:carnitine CoA-transferase CaiB-like acyl-CoA transferase